MIWQPVLPVPAGALYLPWRLDWQQLMKAQICTPLATSAGTEEWAINHHCFQSIGQLATLVCCSVYPGPDQHLRLSAFPRIIPPYASFRTTVNLSHTLSSNYFRQFLRETSVCHQNACLLTQRIKNQSEFSIKIISWSTLISYLKKRRDIFVYLFDSTKISVDCCN